MTVKYGEMENLVTPTISIDQYKPKIGEANETVVVAFEVSFEQPARDSVSYTHLTLPTIYSV